MSSNIIRYIFIFSVLVQIITSNQNEDYFEDSITGSNVKYFPVKIKNNLKNLIISSKLKSTQPSDTVPVYLVSTSQLPNSHKRNKWLCGEIGKKDCIIPKEFLRHKEYIYIAAFCESCEYSFSITYNDLKLTAEDRKNQIENRKLINLPELRLLQVDPENVNQDTQNLLTAADPDFKKLRGMGVSGILYLIIFIISIVIGCYIMMNIYVNTKLVTIPLKLGKIEI